MVLSDKIREAIADSLRILGHPETSFSVDLTDDLSFGDYASNVALVLSRPAGREPKQLAEEIKNQLQSMNLPEFKAIEIAGPGFLNFSIREDWLIENLKTITEVKKEYGFHGQFAGQEIVIEYTNTNVLKPFHIGHLLGNIIGESLSRLFEAGGASVKRVTYQGDTGLHIAKAVWGLKRSGGKKDDLSVKEKLTYLGEVYALGASAYEDDPEAALEIKEINTHLFNNDDKELTDLYHWGRQVSLDSFGLLYKKLGTKFDAYFFESEVAQEAVNIVNEYLLKDVFEKSDGAVVFDGEKYNPSLHTRVFLTSAGLPTYEAKDIAHALRKNNFTRFDKSIIVTAAEQNQYFQVVLEALRQIDKNTAERTEHLSHGMLRLPSGKMSSRSGQVITANDLLDQIESEITTKMAESDVTPNEQKVVAEKVAVGAIKYSILKQDLGKDIIFDFATSISREGNSGPYLQYMLVRAKSVLAKAGKLDNPEQIDEVATLERLLARFPEVVRRSGQEQAPHYLCTYLFILASEFSSYYSEHKIIGDPAEKYRLLLVSAVAQVLQNGLHLLAIPAPERM